MDRSPSETPESNSNSSNSEKKLSWRNLSPQQKRKNKVMGMVALGAVIVLYLVVPFIQKGKGPSSQPGQSKTPNACLLDFKRACEGNDRELLLKCLTPTLAEYVKNLDKVSDLREKLVNLVEKKKLQGVTVPTFDLRRPFQFESVEIGEVKVKGNRATAQLIGVRKGNDKVRLVLKMEKTSRFWRIRAPEWDLPPKKQPLAKDTEARSLQFQYAEQVANGLEDVIGKLSQGKMTSSQLKEELDGLLKNHWRNKKDSKK